MDTRATIEAVLDAAYAARIAEDIEAAAACFTEDGNFCINGGPVTKSRAAQVAALREQFEAFDLLEMKLHCRIIDPPHAAVHWRGRFRNKGGQEAETDILDLIEVKDGRISSLTTFFDTALAAAMLAPA